MMLETELVINYEHDNKVHGELNVIWTRTEREGALTFSNCPENSTCEQK